jgi:hypothetical protein
MASHPRRREFSVTGVKKEKPGYKIIAFQTRLLLDKNISRYLLYIFPLIQYPIGRSGRIRSLDNSAVTRKWRVREVQFVQAAPFTPLSHSNELTSQPSTAVPGSNSNTTTTIIIIIKIHKKENKFTHKI